MDVFQIDGFTPLHYASLKGYLDVCRSLVEAGADVNAQSAVGMTPLHEACVAGRVQVARFLLSRGADIHAKTAAGLTVSFLAGYSKNRAMVKLLKDRLSGQSELF